MSTVHEPDARPTRHTTTAVGSRGTVVPGTESVNDSSTVRPRASGELLNRWQLAVLAPWTAALLAGLALTWRPPMLSFTLVALVVAGFGAEALESKVESDTRVSPSWLVYSLQMALLGPVAAALAAGSTCVMSRNMRAVNRWWNGLVFATLGFAGGWAFRRIDQATGGVQACAANGGRCGSYLAGALAICLAGLPLNFALVWAANFVPSAITVRMRWRTFWHTAPTFAMSAVPLVVVLAAWSRFGAATLVVLGVVVAAFMALLRRTLEAERLAKQLSEMASKLRSERLYRVLANNLPDIAVVLFDAELRVQAVEGGAATPLTAALEGRCLPDVDQLHADVRTAVEAHCRAVLSGERRQFEVEQDGRIFDVSVAPVNDHDASVSGGLVVIREVTDRRRSERRVARMAKYDSLTGLPNRAAFTELLDEAVVRAHGGEPSALLMLDLDGFKAVNDALGHDAGDELLRVVAGRLRDAVRSEDVVARLAGDEFTAILCGASLSEVDLVARRIIESVSEPVALAAQQVFPATSIGVALLSGPRAIAPELLRAADSAMYEAKASGGSCYQVFEDAMASAARERTWIARELRDALANGGLSLHYQPQLELRTNRVLAVEALLRWQHPQLGYIEPSRLVAAAEASGMMVSVGEWVLREACGQGERWRAEGMPLRVAVNISAVQLRHSGFCALVERVLADTGLPSELLELELNELALHDGAGLVAALSRLRALGAHITIDGFGTASLQRVKRLPVDALKLDRSFLATASPVGNSVLRAAIALGGALGLTVSATGVELNEQCKFLLNEGCKLGSGWLFCPALPAGDVARYVRARTATP